MKKHHAAIGLIATLLILSSPVRSEENSRADRVDFIGDFRLRYDMAEEDFEPRKERMRFRARFGFKAQASDRVSFIFGLATGRNNPVSANQDFGDFSYEDIRLDLAAVDWKITNGLNLHAGKMKNPVFRAGGAPVIWDSDWNPEGLAVKFSSGMVFGTVGGFLIETRSGTDDSLLYVAQGGIKFPIGENNKLSVGVGYFGYTNTVGNPAFYDGKARGNTLDSDGNYVFAYKDTEIFAQLDTTIANWPLMLFAHFARNNEVSREDTAFAYGARIGSSKGKGKARLSWAYQDIEADSVIGTFNDSDFGGGGTDSKGHLIKIEYGLSERLFIGGTFFINEVERFQGMEHDYQRIQLDIEIKFD